MRNQKYFLVTLHVMEKGIKTCMKAAVLIYQFNITPWLPDPSGQRLEHQTVDL
jgi:hypothetical protein